MLVESRVVLELKASRQLDSSDVAQLLNYLRATDLELGLLLHFGTRASFKRLIASNGFAHPAVDPRWSVSSASSAAEQFRGTPSLTPLSRE